MPPLTPATIESGNAIPLLQTLGITVGEIGERHAEMSVMVDARHLNYFGGAHGGLLATLADTVCFFPRPFLPSGIRVATVNLNVNYLRPVSLGTLLVARSEIVHLGRRTASLRITLRDGKDDRVVAPGTATLMLLDG